MNSRSLLLIFLALFFAFFLGCKDDDEDTPDDQTGTFGDVGDTWTAKFDDTHDIRGEIIANDNGLITIEVNLGGDIYTIKARLSSDKVEDFIHSNNDLTKPMTMVEWDCQVGDVYTFNIGDLYFARHIIEIEEYHVPALGKSLEMIGVYEYIPDALNFNLFGWTVREISWYWHQTYGLVCIDIWMSDGTMFTIHFLTIEV
jgi:hypothetical protein